MSTDGPRDDELTDDEAAALVASLRSDLAAAPDGVDQLEAAARLGVVLVEWYERTEDPDLLDEACHFLLSAVSADPPLAELPFLRYALGVAYRYRWQAGACVTMDDVDSAVHWLRLACLGPHEDSVEAAGVATEFAELLWVRHRARRYGPDHESFVLAAHVDGVAVEMEELSADGDPERGQYLAMLQGLALLERFEARHDVADLERATGLIGPALESLAPDTPWWADANEQLGLSWVDADAECENDDGVRDRAVFWLGTALDRAEAPDYFVAQEHGILLIERGDERQSIDDLTAAVRSLNIAVATVTPYPSLTWHAWWTLADAHRIRSALSLEDADLASGVDAFTRALACGVPDHDLRVLAHVNRIVLAREALERAVDDVALPTEGAQAFREFLAEGRAALSDAVVGDPLLPPLLAAALALGESIAALHDHGEYDTERVRRLVAVAEELPDPPAVLVTLLRAASGTAAYYEDVHLADGSSAGFGADHFTSALRDPELDAEMRGALTSLQAMAMSALGSHRGSLRESDLVSRIGREHRAADTTGLPADPDLALLLELNALTRASRPDDIAGLRAAVSRAVELLESGTVQPQLAIGLRPIVGVLRQFVDPAAAPLPTGLAQLQALPKSGWAGDIAQTANWLATYAEVVAACAADNPVRLHLAMERLEAEMAEIRSDHPVRLPMLSALGHGYAELAVRSSRVDRQLPDRMVRSQEEAVRLAGNAWHPLWSAVSLRLAFARRLRCDPLQNDVRRSRAQGLAALRGHTWQVVLQDGTARAITAARSAAADAMRVAGWCLLDRSYGELVQALDAGRGLVVHAATSSRQVHQQLVSAGHERLAARWREQGGGVDEDLLEPSDLRFDVLSALAGREAGGTSAGRLLDPPSVPEVQGALARVGADALVYLVPQSDGMPGCAVIVPTSGAVDVLTMPALRIAEGTPLERFLRARAAESAAPDRDAMPVRRAGRSSVDEIAGWAWNAAVGALVRHGQRVVAGRPARLVLAPMGALALVPWHAAYRQEGRSRRYALADTVFSYIASGRLLCEVAGQSNGPPSSALAVGNPTGDLGHAGEEALAIHAAFYPDSRFLGQPAANGSGRGTPAEVLDWLDEQAGTRATLHLACHGRVVPDQALASHLVLADGAELSIGDIIERHRLDGLPLDCVMLAACTTGMSGDDYDEALSLATAFLAAGARSAFGSLWPVPDQATSLLMFMLHHFLRAEGRLPADALREAQLWMLDPHRQPPLTMPASLREHCRHIDVDNLLAWAGFVHFGR